MFFFSLQKEYNQLKSNGESSNAKDESFKLRFERLQQSYNEMQANITEQMHTNININIEIHRAQQQLEYLNDIIQKGEGNIDESRKKLNQVMSMVTKLLNQKNEKSLKEVLKEWNIHEHAIDTIVNGPYLCIADLRRISDEELTELGINTLQIRHIRKQVKEAILKTMTLETILSEINLFQYKDKFEEYGFDDIADWNNIRDEDLKSCLNMKHGEILRWRRKCNEIFSNT